MNFKNILSISVLAIASVSAADKTSSRNTCRSKNGKFLENPLDNSDSRFACILPKSNYSSLTNYYCGTLNGFEGCYEPTLGNMTYCDKKSKDFNSKGCFLGLTALDSAVHSADVQKRDEARKTCRSKSGLFLENQFDEDDTRFACILPKSNFSSVANHYCGTFNNFDGCYEPSLGNMFYCDPTDAGYNSKGCFLGIGYLESAVHSADVQKRDEARKTCKSKRGLFLENQYDQNDTRYACILPKSNFSSVANHYCGTFNGFEGCYEPSLGNMFYCDPTDAGYNSKGCFLGVGYLENAVYSAEIEKRDEARKTCKSKHGKFLENTTDKEDTRFACILPKSNYKNLTNYYCGTLNGFEGCYEPSLGNMYYCDKTDKDFNSKGCFLGLTYLDN